MEPVLTRKGPQTSRWRAAASGSQTAVEPGRSENAGLRQSVRWQAAPGPKTERADGWTAGPGRQTEQQLSRPETELSCDLWECWESFTCWSVVSNDRLVGLLPSQGWMLTCL